ncbi:MAG: hypothetical protein C4526_11800 [Nitrospiraceae bacterium]|nr:MAG: hypothetical protein C4526_11800 [Nitrospiraceae bacterium]
MKKVFIILLTVVFAFTSTAVFAKEKPEAEEIIADLIFLRPLGLISFVFGTSVFIVSLPLAAVTKSTKQTGEVLVKDTFNYTFKRPIGEMESGL